MKAFTLFLSLSLNVLAGGCPTPEGAKKTVEHTNFADIAEQTKDSVVNVASINVRPDDKGLAHRMHTLFLDPKKDLFGSKVLNAPKRQVAVGSGFIIQKEGTGTYYLVTNNHTIENSIAIRVILTDESIHEATLVGRDASTDIAVLKFKSAKPLKALKWGSSDKLRIGEWSMALGNPYGLGGTSLTTGVISYLERDLLRNGRARRTLVDNYIQTEAAINPGNSGGPLLNLKGEVIGVNTVIITPSGGSHNVGFAIPESLAREISNKLIKSRKVKRAWLGTVAQALNKDLAKYLGLSSIGGAVITDVTPHSPAEKAGIKRGDVVLSINKKPLKKFSDLAIMGRKIEVGEAADFEIFRGGKTFILKPVMEEYQDHEAYQNNLRIETIKPEDHAYNQAFDFGVATLTPQFRQRFGIVDTGIQGVLISDVKDEGIAEKHTFLVGDILLEINGQKIEKIEDVNKTINQSLKTHPEKPILFFIYRDINQSLFIAIDPKTLKGKKSASKKKA